MRRARQQDWLSGPARVRRGQSVRLLARRQGLGLGLARAPKAARRRFVEPCNLPTPPPGQTLTSILAWVWPGGGVGRPDQVKTVGQHPGGRRPYAKETPRAGTGVPHTLHRIAADPCPRRPALGRHAEAGMRRSPRGLGLAGRIWRGWFFLSALRPPRSPARPGPYQYTCVGLVGRGSGAASPGLFDALTPVRAAPSRLRGGGLVSSRDRHSRPSPPAQPPRGYHHWVAGPGERAGQVHVQ